MLETANYLSARGDPEFASKLTSQPVRALFTYWNTERPAGEHLPRRSFRPGAVRALLPIVQIYDLIDGGPAYRLRLMGTEISRFMGSDLTGQEFHPNTDDPVLARVMHAVERCIADGAPIALSAERTTVPGRGWYKVDAVWLPMTCDCGRLEHMLVATHFQVRPDLDISAPALSHRPA